MKSLRDYLNLIESLEKPAEHGVVEGAPELLKAEMPLVRHIERELSQHGYEKGTAEYHKEFNHALAYYSKFGNIDLINKRDEQDAATAMHKAHGGWKCRTCGYDGDENVAVNRFCASCHRHR